MPSQRVITVAAIIAVLAMVLATGGLLLAARSSPELQRTGPAPRPTSTVPDPFATGSAAPGSVSDLFSGIDQIALAQCAAEIVAAGGDLGPAPDATDADAVVAATARDVLTMRGLSFTEDVTPEFLANDEINARLAADAEESYPPEDADLDQRTLRSLFAIGDDVDLRQLVIDLQVGQVAGYYDPETAELVVRSPGGGAISATDRVTLAHELEHALVDQTLPLPFGDDGPQDADGATAALAVIEGDATLVMTAWATSRLSLVEQLFLGADPDAAAAAEQLATAPHVLQRGLLFPYEAGLGFICELYRTGGWDAVNAAYASPPPSTAHVMEPARHLDAEPIVAVDTSVTLGDGWDLVREDTFGMLDLLILFEAPGDDRSAALRDARDLAAEWTGGEIDLHVRGADSTIVVALAERPGGADLCLGLRSWLEAAMPGFQGGTLPSSATTLDGRRHAGLRCGDDQHLLVISDDAGTRDLAFAP